MSFKSNGNEGLLIRKIAPSISIDFYKSDKQTTLHIIIHKAQVFQFDI